MKQLTEQITCKVCGLPYEHYHTAKRPKGICRTCFTRPADRRAFYKNRAKAKSEHLQKRKEAAISDSP